MLVIACGSQLEVTLDNPDIIGSNLKQAVVFIALHEFQHRTEELEDSRHVVSHRIKVYLKVSE